MSDERHEVGMKMIIDARIFLNQLHQKLAENPTDFVWMFPDNGPICGINGMTGRVDLVKGYDRLNAVPTRMWVRNQAGQSASIVSRADAILVVIAGQEKFIKMVQEQLDKIAA